jgi:hypothetical protein
LRANSPSGSASSGPAAAAPGTFRLCLNPDESRLKCSASPSCGSLDVGAGMPRLCAKPRARRMMALAESPGSKWARRPVASVALATVSGQVQAPGRRASRSGMQASECPCYFVMRECHEIHDNCYGFSGPSLGLTTIGTVIMSCLSCTRQKTRVDPLARFLPVRDCHGMAHSSIDHHDFFA